MPPSSYHIENSAIRICTKHFTKFILTNTKKEVEITDALLTVAAEHYTAGPRAYVNLRLMLHSHCAELNDFSEKRKAVSLVFCREHRIMKYNSIVLHRICRKSMFFSQFDFEHVI